MEFRNILTAAIKVATSTVVAAIAAWLLSLGIDIGEATTAFESGLFVLLVSVTNGVINTAAQKWPWIGSFFSLGLSRANPQYEQTQKAA